MPWTMEGVVMPAREAPVRECPLCPATAVSCSHFEGRVVCMTDRNNTSHSHPLTRWRVDGRWKVSGPADVSQVHDCHTCGARNGAIGPPVETSGHTTEAEARAEFDRRVSLMLGREQEES